MRTSDLVKTLIEGVEFNTLYSTSLLALELVNSKLAYRDLSTRVVREFPLVYSNADQEITGNLTIKDSPLSFGKSGILGNAKWQIEEDSTTQLLISKIYNDVKTSYFAFNSNSFNPVTDNTNELGTTNKRYKNIFLSGNLSDGTNSISVLDMVNKVTKNKVSHSNDVVYGSNAAGNSDILIYTASAPFASALVRYDSNGMFTINDPTQSNHPASKSYVDTAVAAIADGVLTYNEAMAILEGE